MTDYSFDNRLKEFNSTALPRYIEDFERYLGLALSQASFTVHVSNTGSLRADRLMIRISGEGLLLHSKVLTLTPHGPTAPSPRPGSGLVIPPAYRPPRPIGDHEVHFARKPVAGGHLIEAHCEDFRHGETWSFDGFAALDPAFDGPAVIEVELTAANKKGALASSFTFKKHVLDLSFADVAEAETLRFKRRPNLEAETRALMEQEAWDRLDISWLGAET